METYRTHILHHRSKYLGWR